jgi:hypothetical protein
MSKNAVELAQALERSFHFVNFYVLNGGYQRMIVSHPNHASLGLVADSYRDLLSDLEELANKIDEEVDRARKPFPDSTHLKAVPDKNPLSDAYKAQNNTDQSGY